jgi:DNA-binding NarL/FixJ family response regulator
LRCVLRGGAPIDPFVAKRIIGELPAESAESAEPVERKSEEGARYLSKRESQILKLVADGLNNRDIAEHLFVSRYTVECHIKHIYAKLAVSSRTRAVHAARQRGLLG